MKSPGSVPEGDDNLHGAGEISPLQRQSRLEEVLVKLRLVGSRLLGVTEQFGHHPLAIRDRLDLAVEVFIQRNRKSQIDTPYVDFRPTLLREEL